MKSVDFAPWEPDKAAYGGGHSPEAQGVIPASRGYVPFPSFSPDTTIPPLPGKCKGAISFVDVAGNPLLVAATEDSIYHLYSKEWVRKGTGYPATYSGWNFTVYGDILIAVNGVSVPLFATVYVGGLSDFEAIDKAPVGTCTEVVKTFVFVGGVGGTALQWSAIDDPLTWPEPGSNDAQYKQADKQVFPDSGNITAITGGLSGMDGLVFTERAIYRAQYVGTPYFFQFDTLDKGRGAIASRSVVTGSNAVYFLSEEGFFATDGAQVRNIGFERVNEWFRALSSDSRRNEVRGDIEPVKGIIVWSFPSKHAPDGMHDYILVYHALLDKWSYAKLDTTEILNALSQGRTLEDLNSVGPLDELPYSLDSRVWMGGIPGIAAISADNCFGWFAASPMPAIIDTSETGGKRFMVHGVRPLIDGEESRVSILYRDFQHLPVKSVECSAPSAFDGFAHTHVSTRYARARVIIPGKEPWSHALGCDLLTEDEGGL